MSNYTYLTYIFPLVYVNMVSVRAIEGREAVKGAGYTAKEEILARILFIIFEGSSS